jgi:hypothetical protein
MVEAVRCKQQSSQRFPSVPLLLLSNAAIVFARAYKSHLTSVTIRRILWAVISACYMLEKMLQLNSRARTQSKIGARLS